jgi:hypothetical protein
LWEGGFDLDEIVRVLVALPGSKSRERGEEYARRTVAKASGAAARITPKGRFAGGDARS